MWEYMTWRLTNNPGTADARVRHVDGEEFDSKERPSLYEALREAGDAGWELVATPDNVSMIFKRRKPEGPQGG